MSDDTPQTGEQDTDLRDQIAHDIHATRCGCDGSMHTTLSAPDAIATAISLRYQEAADAVLARVAPLLAADRADLRIRRNALAAALGLPATDDERGSDFHTLVQRVADRAAITQGITAERDEAWQENARLRTERDRLSALLRGMARRSSMWRRISYKRINRLLAATTDLTAARTERDVYGRDADRLRKDHAQATRERYRLDTVLLACNAQLEAGRSQIHALTADLEAARTQHANLHYFVRDLHTTAYQAGLLDRLAEDEDWTQGLKAAIAAAGSGGRSMPAAPAREMCSACGEPENPTHDATALSREGDLDRLARLLAAYGLVSGGDTRPLAAQLWADFVAPLLAAERASRQDWATEAQLLHHELDTLCCAVTETAPARAGDIWERWITLARADQTPPPEPGKPPVDPGQLRREVQRLTATLDPEAHNG